MPITPGLCSACGGGGSTPTPDFEHNSVVLCDTLADGTVVAAVILVQEYDETTGLPVGAPVPTNPATGAPYTPVGTLQSCSSESPLSLGSTCYTQVGPFTTFVPSATSVPAASGIGNAGQPYVATAANWGGSGVPLSLYTFGDFPGDVGDSVNVSGANIVSRIDLGAVFTSVTVDFEFFDAANNERLTGINQPFTLGAGTDGTIGDGGTSYTPGPVSYASGSANLVFGGPVQIIDFTFVADATPGTPAAIAVQNVTAAAVTKEAIAVQCDSCVGPVTYRDSLTSAPVAAASLTNCSTQVDISAPVVVVPQAPVFAGFVCDVFGGTPLIPATQPSCPGTPLAPIAASNARVGPGLTEGPAGTFTATGPDGDTSYTFAASNQSLPTDPLQGLCSVAITFDADTGNDPFWQIGGDFVDINGNGQFLDAVWITAIETALGVGDASDIPAGSTATASVGGTAITITFNGPSSHSQMFAGNGAWFLRQQDADGLAAGITLDFNPPIQSFRILPNVTLPSVGSFSNLQVAQATPGTSAVPAQPAGIFQVKQFRNNDGSSFYENLDGSAHAVEGTVGECGEYTQEVLCDATGTSFLRVYKIAGGTVTSFQDYDLAGAVFAAATPVGICSETLATFRHTPTEVLCYTATDGTVTQFLRRYLINQDGIAVVAVLDTLLDGTTPFLALTSGVVAQCSNGGSSPTEDCDSTVLGTICYTPPPGSTISPGTHRGPDDWAGSTTVGANGGPQTITNANFAGAGITVISTDSFGSGIIATNRIAMAHPAATEVLTLDLGAPRLNVTLVFNSFGPAGTEVIDSFSPAFTSITGDGVASVGNTQIGATLAAGTVSVHFAGPVQTIDYHARTTTGQFALQSVEFDEIITTPNTQTQGTAAVVRDCTTGVVSYVDLASGATIDLTTVTVVDCGATSTAVVTRDEELLVLCDTAPTTPAATVSGDWTGATAVGGVGGGAGTYTKTNWGGSGITVTAAQDFLHGSSVAGNIDLSRTPAAPGAVVTTINLGAVRQNIFLTLNYFGTNGGEQVTNLVPAADAVTGAATLGGGGTTVTPTTVDGSAVVHIPGPTQTVVLTWNSAGGLSGIGNITFDTFAVPGATSRFLRKYNYDGQTGAFIGTVDTALDGTTPHVIVGTVSQCSDAAAVTPVTTNAQAVLLTAGQAWTPGGSVTGTLTGVAFAVVTGTTTVTDSNGTVSAGLPPGLTGSWEVGDADALTGPQSIAAVGGSTWITWTQR